MCEWFGWVGRFFWVAPSIGLVEGMGRAAAGLLARRRVPGPSRFL